MGFGSGFGPGFGPGFAQQGEAALAFAGPVISTLNLVVDQPFSASYAARFSGGADPITFEIVGSLPTGLTMDPNGTLSGAPTVLGSAAGLVVRATDVDTITADSNSFTINVVEALPRQIIQLRPSGGLSSYRKRRWATDLAAFSTLIVLPADLGDVDAAGTSDELVLPAGARLAISHSVQLTAGQATVNVGARRSFSHPALDANEVFRGIHGEKNMPVSISRGAAAAGTLTLHVIDLFGVPRPVAFATFT